MGEVTKAKARRPTSFELRSRVVAAIEKFITEDECEEWHAAFSSHQFRLLIDDQFRVFIAELAAPTAALFIFSAPLRELGLDPWAVELGQGVKDAALDIAAESVVRKLERSKFWVP
jgi:hypothetical protein